MSDAENTFPAFPARDPAGHKGTFGTVVVIGGQTGPAVMLGGPALTAVAALRIGAGLAKLAAPAPILPHALAVAPSATGVALPVDDEGGLIAHLAAETFDALLPECACIAIGPGLGVSEPAAAISLRAVNQTEAPVVADADALNNLADTPELQRDFHAQAILTPHPGEHRRLAASLGIKSDPTDDAARTDAAEQLAQRLGCVVVLKGARTVVSDGQRSWTNELADSALATAGTGDVLTGVIAGLVAQWYKRPLSAGSRTITSERRGGLSLYDCARLGVRVHSLAAGLWRESRGAGAGLLAMELTDHVPAAAERLRQGA